MHGVYREKDGLIGDFFRPRARAEAVGGLKVEIVTKKEEEMQQCLENG